MNSIAELFYTRIWGLREDLLITGKEIIERHLRGEKLPQDEIELRTSGKRTDTIPYEIKDGIAYIPIYGIIAKRSSMINGLSQPRGTSVESIIKNLNDALNNPEVKKIVLNIDSPGGSAEGIAELSDMIFQSREKKEIVSYTDGSMDSAAYWIGSSSSKIYATKGADIGSIGVYTVIRDFSVYEHNEGIKTMVIRAGKYKAAGHPSKPMMEDDIAVIQENVNTIFMMFKDAVKRNRNMTDDQVNQVALGRTWLAGPSKELGLIDEVVNIDSVFNIDSIYSKTVTNKAEQVETVSTKEAKIIKEENIAMDLKDLKIEQLQAERPDLVNAISENSKKAAKADIENAKLEGISAGIIQERQRVKDIIMDKSCNEFRVFGLQDKITECILGGKSKDESLSVLKDTHYHQLLVSNSKAPGASETAKNEMTETSGSSISSEEQLKRKWDSDKKLQAEFFGNFEVYKAYEEGIKNEQIKIISK